MRRLDLVGGAFWLCFSIFVAVESFRVNLGSWQKPGSGFLPFGAACMLGILSGIVFLQAIRAEKVQEEKAWPEIKGVLKVILLLAFLLGYVLCVEKLGFIITTFLFLSLLLKTIEPQSWRKTIVFSFLGSFLSYLIFQICLKAQLPTGLLSGIGF